MFRKILVAIDDGDTNQNVFREAMNLALTTDAQLLLTYVVPPFSEIYPEPAYIAVHGYHPTIHGETTINHYMQRMEA